MAALADLPEPLADSVSDAAHRIGISRSQAYKELASGRLKARKLGKRTLIERSEQARFLSDLPAKSVRLA